MNAHVKPRLLIVEDDEGLQRQLRWAYDDYEVLVASDRGAAVDLLRAAEPAVVTLDLGLPPDPDGVSEGFAALEAILKLKPETKVIVASGHGARESALRAIASGAYEARALILSMGGRLEVESRVGEGTSFTLFLSGAEAGTAHYLDRMRA